MTKPTEAATRKHLWGKYGTMRVISEAIKFRGEIVLPVQCDCGRLKLKNASRLKEAALQKGSCGFDCDFFVRNTNKKEYKTGHPLYLKWKYKRRYAQLTGKPYSPEVADFYQFVKTYGG